MIEHRTNDFAIYRDDHFPYLGGGNKARKMMALHDKVVADKYTALVTTGGIQSNHCRAVALYAEKYNLKCTLVIHGDQKEFLGQTGNAKIIRSTNANRVFCESCDISKTMNKAIESYQSKGDKPFYIKGGGHHPEAAKAYLLEIEKMKNEKYVPDYIFVASGTGSTHAGILAGISKYGLHTKVIGISVGRTKKRAEEITKEFYEELCQIHEISNKDEVIVEDAYLYGGYGECNEELQELEKKSLVHHGLFLDCTYTAKVFHGMKKMIALNQWNGKVLFWYTGGIYNYMAK